MKCYPSLPLGHSLLADPSPSGPLSVHARTCCSLVPAVKVGSEEIRAVLGGPLHLLQELRVVQVVPIGHDDHLSVGRAGRCRREAKVWVGI
jgi:hypothetical protein